jgi:hypothetical protein
MTRHGEWKRSDEHEVGRPGKDLSSVIIRDVKAYLSGSPPSPRVYALREPFPSSHVEVKGVYAGERETLERRVSGPCRHIIVCM